MHFVSFSEILVSSVLVHVVFDVAIPTCFYIIFKMHTLQSILFCSGHFINGSVPQCKPLPLARMVFGSTSSDVCSCGVASLQRNSAICSAKTLLEMLMCNKSEVVSTAEQQVAHSYDCILTNCCS